MATENFTTKPITLVDCWDEANGREYMFLTMLSFGGEEEILYRRAGTAFKRASKIEF